MTCCCGVFFGRSQARSPTEAGLGIFLRPTPAPFHRQVCLLLYSSCFTNVQLTRWFSCCCIYPLLWAGLLGEDLGDGLNCVQQKLIFMDWRLFMKLWEVLGCSGRLWDASRYLLKGESKIDPEIHKRLIVYIPS